MGSCERSDEPLGNSGIAKNLIFLSVFYSVVLVIIVINCGMFIRKLKMY